MALTKADGLLLSMTFPAKVRSRDAVSRVLFQLSNSVCFRPSWSQNLQRHICASRICTTGVPFRWPIKTYQEYQLWIVIFSVETFGVFCIISCDVLMILDTLQASAILRSFSMVASPSLMSLSYLNCARIILKSFYTLGLVTSPFGVLGVLGHPYLRRQTKWKPLKL